MAGFLVWRGGFWRGGWRGEWGAEGEGGVGERRMYNVEKEGKRGEQGREKSVGEIIHLIQEGQLHQVSVSSSISVSHYSSQNSLAHPSLSHTDSSFTLYPRPAMPVSLGLSLTAKCRESLLFYN